jgi:hypothetical protein
MEKAQPQEPQGGVFVPARRIPAPATVSAQAHAILSDPPNFAGPPAPEAMPHGGFFGAPEDQEVLDEQARFITGHLKKVYRDG